MPETWLSQCELQENTMKPPTERLSLPNSSCLLWNDCTGENSLYVNTWKEISAHKTRFEKSKRMDWSFSDCISGLMFSGLFIKCGQDVKHLRRLLADLRTRGTLECSLIDRIIFARFKHLAEGNDSRVGSPKILQTIERQRKSTKINSQLGQQQIACTQMVFVLCWFFPFTCFRNH